MPVDRSQSTRVGLGPFASARAARWAIVAGLAALLCPPEAAAQSCPTRIPLSSLSSIKNAEFRNITASKVIDQAFIDQNGGAEAMIAVVRQQITGIEPTIQSAENCVAQSSQDPSAVTANLGTTAGSCRAALDAARDAKRASEAWLPVLQCWASQSAGNRTGPTTRGTGPGIGPNDLPVRAPSGRALEGLVNALGALRNSDTPALGYTSNLDTDWNAVQRRVAVREERVKAACGEAPGASGLLPQLTQTNDDFAVSRSAMDALEARQREFTACADRVRAAFDADALAGAAPSPSFQPLLGSGDNPGVSGAVDSILNAGAAGNASDASARPPQATRLPYEFEMARTNRPDRDFLKRVSGELRSANGQHQLSIAVSDIDRGWMTTDSCTTLDVTFQATLTASAPGGSRSFPVFTVPVTATDGTADVRIQAPLAADGQPTGINVVRVDARACETPPPPPPAPGPDCTATFDARVRLLTLSRELMARRMTLEEGLADLEAARTEVQEDTGQVTSTFYAALVRLNTIGAGVRVLLLAAQAPTTLAAIELQAVLKTLDTVNTVKDVGLAVQNNDKVAAEAFKASLSSLEGTTEDIAKELGDTGSRFAGPLEFLNATAKSLSAFLGVKDAIEKEQEFAQLRETTQSAVRSLDTMMRPLRARLADLDRQLEDVGETMAALGAACGR